MSNRLVVPVEYVLAAIPDSEIAFANDGSNPRLRYPGGELPVIGFREWWDNEDGDDMLYEMEGEWPATIPQN